MAAMLPSVLFQTHSTHQSPQTMVDQQVNHYLGKSAQLAKQILAPAECGYTDAQRRIGRVQINNYNVGGPSLMPMMVPVPHPVYHVHTAPHYHIHHGSQHAEKEQEGPSNGLRIIVGIASALLGGWAIYKVGQTLNHISSAGDELKENSEFQGRIREWNYRLIEAGQENNPGIKAMKVISEKRHSIFSRIKENAVLNLIIAVGAVAAAIFGLAGSVIGSFALLGLALASGVAIGGALLFKLGYASSDQSDIKDAQAIREQLAVLKGDSFYQETCVEETL